MPLSYLSTAPNPYGAFLFIPEQLRATTQYAQITLSFWAIPKNTSDLPLGPPMAGSTERLIKYFL
ncbi:hypothetical protein SCT_0341 [Sulfuricella sp. T08]|nr:hypothetical protein SCT_0341 [Sulfuricella sp. T08]